MVGVDKKFPRCRHTDEIRGFHVLRKGQCHPFPILQNFKDPEGRDGGLFGAKFRF